MHPGMMMQAMRQDKTALSQKLSRATLKRVLAFAVPQRRAIFGFLSIVVLDSALVVVTPLLIRELIDNGIAKGDGAKVTWLAVAMLITAIAGAGLSVISGYLSSRIGENLIFQLRTTVFAHVQRLGFAFFTRSQTGALVSRLNNDVIGAQRAFTSTLSGTVSNLISVVVVGIAMLSLSWQVTAACLMLFPLLFVGARKVGDRIAALTRQQMDGNAVLGAVMTERFNVGGALLMKLFGRRAKEDENYAEKAAVVRDLGVQIALIGRIFLAMLTLIPAAATALAYGLGGHLVLQQTLTLGTLLALATLLLRLLGPLQGLSNVRLDIMTALVSFERIFEVLDLKSTVIERSDAVKLTNPKGEVKFDRVGFSYPDTAGISIASLELADAKPTDSEIPVLTEVSFEIKPGQLVALVGPSGAGKTTAIYLLARLYDVSSGAIYLDGHNLQDLSLESVEQAVGYVTQDAHMFHDTIAANLRYANEAATDAELIQALTDAQIIDLINKLPAGLETVVGDRGYRLSGGERQRLAIARMLLKNPQIVVLDEATAHLDSESEAAVQAALERAMGGRTSLVIAHRLSTIRNADLILVLADGKIVQRGNHAELIKQPGLYAELCQTQFQRQD